MPSKNTEAKRKERLLKAKAGLVRTICVWVPKEKKSDIDQQIEIIGNKARSTED
jgi:hypothetical protein